MVIGRSLDLPANDRRSAGSKQLHPVLDLIPRHRPAHRVPDGSTAAAVTDRSRDRSAIVAEPVRRLVHTREVTVEV